MICGTEPTFCGTNLSAHQPRTRMNTGGASRSRTDLNGFAILRIIYANQQDAAEFIPQMSPAQQLEIKHLRGPQIVCGTLVTPSPHRSRGAK